MPRKEGTIVGGKYRICRLIGRGGASCVYLAEDVRLGARWAVKEVFPERMADAKSLAGVIAEARLMKSLSHPALPRIVDLIYGEVSILIVMDFIDGTPLDRVLAAEGLPNAATAMEWTIQIAEILDYLHSLDPPVIYRDLKPANLILESGGRIRLIDFNAARRYRPGKARDTEPLGTRGYAPPEQYGKAQTDARSDLYALGVTIKEFCGSDRSGVLWQAARRCTEKNPADRFGSAAELISFLKSKKVRSVSEEKIGSARLVLLTLILSAIFLIGGIFFRALSTFTVEAAYRQALIGDQTASPQEREERLYDAIRTEPEKADAYLALIAFYEKQRKIDEDQSRRLLSCLLENARALGVPEADTAAEIPGKIAAEKVSAQSCEILYRAAMLHFFAYCGSGGDLSDGARRALASDSLFLTLSELSPADEAAGRMVQQSVCFHRVCSFLSEYASNLTYLSDPDASDLAELLSAADGCVHSIVSGEASPSQYAALSILFEIAGVLREYRDGIAKNDACKTQLRQISGKIQDYLSDIQPDTGENRALLEKVKETARDLLTDTEET